MVKREGARRRAYHSPVRQRQAQETRQSIVTAARALFRERGYAGASVEAIAAQAGVSPKTVLAAFGSKHGILSEVLNPAALGDPHEELLTALRGETDPARRIALAARLTRQVYDERAPELELLHGAVVFAPELAELARTVAERRRLRQERLITFLREQGTLRADRTPEEATDELWALASFDVYRMLVLQRGWPAAHYESWLGQVLAERLLGAR